STRVSVARVDKTAGACCAKSQRAAHAASAVQLRRQSRTNTVRPHRSARSKTRRAERGTDDGEGPVSSFRGRGPESAVQARCRSRSKARRQNREATYVGKHSDQQRGGDPRAVVDKCRSAATGQ